MRSLQPEFSGKEHATAWDFTNSRSRKQSEIPWQRRLNSSGNVIPGLEASLEGKSARESVKITIPPEDAYGEWDKAQVLDIPRRQFSGVDEVKAGMEFSVHSSRGEQIVIGSKVEGETVTVDANQPLAGKTLNFDVTVVDVRDATEDEIAHGHAHGAGGAH